MQDYNINITQILLHESNEFQHRDKNQTNKNKQGRKAHKL